MPRMARTSHLKKKFEVCAVPWGYIAQLLTPVVVVVAYHQVSWGFLILREEML